MHIVTMWIKKYVFLSKIYKEGVSKLSFQCGCRDAKFCVSTVWLDKPLILNVLYIVADIEMRHATSLLMAKSHFDTPSTTVFDKLLIFNILYVVTLVETWRAASLQHQCRNFDTPTFFCLKIMRGRNMFLGGKPKLLLNN